MEQVIFNSILKAGFAYLLLIIVLRIIGRKAVAQLTIFDMGVGVTLGSVTASLAIGSDHSTLAVGTILVTFGLLAHFTGFLSLKSHGLRKLIEAEPLTLIENGRLIEQNMGKTRLTLDKLMSLLRDKNIFNVADVEFALFETDGKISVLPKSRKKPLTPSDLNIPTKYTGLTTDLIMDGNIMLQNLAAVDLDERWLSDQLHSRGFKSVKEVFYAGLDSQGSLYVSGKVRKTGCPGWQKSRQ